MTSLSEDRSVPWFDDGNVIIAVEGNHFRVHRGVLSSYSTVFKDMFLCSKSDDPALSTVEGCPVVTLYNSVFDVQTVFLAMYDRGYASPAKPIRFPTLSAFLRLGKKYIIHQLFDEARECLEIFARNLTTKTLTSNGTPSLGTNIIGQDKFNFQIINLAREVGLLSILPVTLFLCALSCPMEYVLEGYDDEVVGACKLSPENQRACVIGRDKLPAIYSRGFKWLRNPTLRTNRHASDPFQCAKVCDRINREIWADSPRDALWDPFTGWNPKWESKKSRFCDGCGEVCRALHEQARQQAWVELPSIFGLVESWEELETKTYSCDLDETSLS